MLIINKNCNANTYNRKEYSRPLNKIHILIISQYFHPETFRINDMATEWVKRGYKVTVLTGIPNYPIGKFFEGYGFIKRRREKWNGIEIIRLPLLPRGSDSIGIAINYLSFVVSGWLWKMITDIHADLVFTFEVSPMTQALIGCWYSKKHNIPHYLYVQDLWPENVEVVGGIKNKKVLKAIDHMVDYIYENTERIFTTSPSFRKVIINRGISKSKVYYWPQYAEEFYKVPDRSKAKDLYGKYDIPNDDSFKIAFTGNIGTAQDLDILIKVAEQQKKCDERRGSCNQDKSMRFIIVGDGRYKEMFEKKIERRNVRSYFIMIPRQPAENIPELLSLCDAAFLSFKDIELWKMTIPAKLQSYMACGMLIIASACGETERVIKEAGCGICTPAGDSHALMKAIQKMIKTRDNELEQMRKNSRKYYEKNFDKAVLMEKMDGYFQL